MKTLLIFVLFSSTTLLFSQERRAYFQQKVDFDIEVTLDDKKHELKAFEKITYTNNSSEILDSI
jgi:hypothetical protein